MPPWKILKNRCPDIEFGGILESLMVIMYNNFKIQIKF